MLYLQPHGDLIQSLGFLCTGLLLLSQSNHNLLMSLLQGGQFCRVGLEKTLTEGIETLSTLLAVCLQQLGFLRLERILHGHFRRKGHILFALIQETVILHTQERDFIFILRSQTGFSILTLQLPLRFELIYSCIVT